MNGTVGPVHAFPGPAIKVIVVFHEVVVEVARGPRARLLDVAIAHLAGSACHVPDVGTGHGSKAVIALDRAVLTWWCSICLRTSYTEISKMAAKSPFREGRKTYYSQQLPFLR